MNCYLHPEATAVAFCRTCGRAVCQICQRPADGTVFCPEHVPAGAAYAPSSPDPFAGAGTNPYVAPPTPVPVQTSPGLAFLLGLIPGVGAIYNGQYVKGLVHAVVFGLLMSLNESADRGGGSPFLIMMMAAFYFYMPFEAYHTARKRQLGVPIDEWSSVLAPGRFGSRAPIGPIVLIVLGVLFLLDSLGVLRMSELGRFWPVLLIVAGGIMLYSRLTCAAGAKPVRPAEIVEGTNER